MRRILGLGLVCALGSLLFVACGGDADVNQSSGGSSGSAGAAGSAATGGSGGLILDGGGGSSGDSSTDADPCVNTVCSKEQHCEVQNGTGTCVPNDCASLGCQATEKCVQTDAGAYCENNACKDDVDCPANQYCNGTVCVDDQCTPGDTKCQGQDLLGCEPNGSGMTKKFGCASGSPYYQSTCTDDGKGDASCPCEDDWDCPAYTNCEAGRCVGTGVAPTCSLPPEPFANVLPGNEITWGGKYPNPQATGSPFPASTQVVITPLVVNLDDDTGDGVIDERDFPEIVFTSFCNSQFTSNGILRAIHGGGPNKGKDYFANCGGTEWHEGDPLTVSCACDTAELDSTAVLAAGDLDNDGKP